MPRDPHDGDDVVMEIKSGEGGEESALFAGDLARMYPRYAERRGWKVEVLDAIGSDLGGVKDLTMVLRSRGTDPDGVWAALKYEGGVHRVQRVPVTESQGRDPHLGGGRARLPGHRRRRRDVEIDENDLRVDVFRSSGHGGQSVNTTDSAVRITHLPTGIVVSCQNERSQLQNRARAMEVLRSRLQALAEAEAAAQASDARRSQVRTVDRSERIRTYNFPENRISDHRVGYKAYNLSAVLDGDLDGGARRPDRGRPGRAAGPMNGESRSSPRRVRRFDTRLDVTAARPPRRGRAELAAAGVASPRFDAESLAAHVLGVRAGGWLMLPPVDPPVAVEALRALVARRAAREPLQHLLGTAVLGPVEVAVGPGVFTPRPETELLLEWGLARAHRTSRRRWSWTCAPARARSRWPSPPCGRTPTCTPSSSTRTRWRGRGATSRDHGGRGRAARRRRARTRPPARARGPGRPRRLQPALRPRRHAGPARGRRLGPGGGRLRRRRTGWTIIRAVVARAGALLRPGGALAVEHDDTHADAVPALLRARPELADVEEHPDLNGRPRYATARRRSARTAR